MKRDFDLIRRILIDLENEPEAAARLFPQSFPEWPSETVNYHIWLLMQSGLVSGVCNHEQPRAGFNCYAVCLTWQGHEFLAAVRDDTAWRKLRQTLADKSVDLSFEALKAAAALLLKQVF